MMNRLSGVLDSNPLTRILNSLPPAGSYQGTININVNYNVHVSGTDVRPYGRNGAMKKTYVVLQPGEDGYIVATCPSMPGCISQGKTRDEAIENIKEAIELCREVIAEQGLPEFEVVELEV